MKDGEGRDRTLDLIIVGGGPAGLTAGLYGGRARLDTLLLEGGLVGGQMVTTNEIDNYPGFPDGITGGELTRLMEEQARAFECRIVYETATGIELGEEIKTVLAGDKTYRGRSVILSPGTEYRKLGVPGEKEFTGRGVSYCATCDGPFFKGGRIVVVGGGDSAITEALFLTRFAREITIVHRRDALRAEKFYQEKAFAEPKINFVWDSVVEEIKGNQTVEKVVVRNVKTKETREIQTDGVFMFVGIIPKTAFLRGTVELDELGYIVTDEACRTSAEGVFAAGDARKSFLKQIATAVGDGATAASAAAKYLEEKHG
ncbi:MAG: thioredoxin-disulfide reductase [Deltaproteobacteria bacterium]|nr:thioredoxin-disulfide reductase [Deltaproteobacteria bacterium]MBW2120813.1 thioredoxin-disulfide reductase [Deltaproteobacteria bacterium]